MFIIVKSHWFIMIISRGFSHDHMVQHNTLLKTQDITCQHLKLAEETALAIQHHDLQALKVHKREVMNRIDHLSGILFFSVYHSLISFIILQREYS